jgi:hypothetical protein
MKKSIVNKPFKSLLFVLIFLPMVSFAAIPARTWTKPLLWTLDEEITWYFDMSGTAFTDGQDIYMWAWQPSEPDAGNWTNSSDFAKLKYEGNMIWSKTLTPTTYFNKTIAQLATFDNYFWMLLKSKDGSTVSEAFNIVCPRAEIGTFISSGVAVKAYPTNFDITTPVTILVNISKAYVDGTQGVLAGSDSIYIQSGLNNFLGASVDVNLTDPTSLLNTKMKKVGTNTFKIDLTPYQYFSVAQDFTFDNFVFYIWSKNGKKGTDANNKPFLLGNTNTPLVSYFPQKFCQYDILTITRINNEKSATGLTYTVTAGSKTFSGQFSGTTASMKTYINLGEQIGNEPSLTQMNLKINVVSGSNSIEVYNTNLPIVPLSELQ